MSMLKVKLTSFFIVTMLILFLMAFVYCQISALEHDGFSKNTFLIIIYYYNYLLGVWVGYRL